MEHSLNSYTPRSWRSKASYATAKEWQILNMPENVRSRSAPTRRKEPISLFDLCPAAGHAERSCPRTHTASSAGTDSTDSTKVTLALGLYNVDTEQFEVNVRSWPRRSSELHEAVIDVLFAHGFVPDPDTFHQPHPNGYGGHPTVFSFLETCLDRRACPNSRIYACVAPGMASEHMLCLVTKVPLFDFHFAVLRRCRQAARDGFSGFELLADQLSDTELAAAAAAGSVDLSLALGPRCVLRLALPRAPTGDLEADAAEFVCHWAVGALLQDMPALFGSDLLLLIALVLQEHKVLLVGETRHVNKIALLLYALLHPFRWHHLFLPAAVPPRNQFAAFEECPVPMIVAREVLSEEYRSFDTLPRSLIPVCVSSEGIELKGRNFAWRLEQCLGRESLFRRCCGFESGPPLGTGPPLGSQDPELDSLGRPLCGFPEERRLRKELAAAMGRGGKLEAAEVLQVLRSGVADAAAVVRGFARAAAERLPEADLEQLLREQYHEHCFKDWYGSGGHSRRGEHFRRFFCSLLDSQACVDLFCQEVQEQRSKNGRIPLSYD